jgi:alpha-ribazole phosphatase/probable phosphoglycerate mutase
MASSPTRLYLMRHGQVQGHEEKRYNGQGEVPLTPVGIRQFEVLAERLRPLPLTAVYSSDLTRCREGARRIASEHGLTPVTTPELREICMGEWEGTTWAELQARDPRGWQARLADPLHFRVPGGENLLDVVARIRPVLARIVRDHPGEAVAMVAHGGVNRLILLDALGAPLDRLFRLEQDFGCLNIVDLHPDGTRLVRLVNG